MFVILSDYMILNIIIYLENYICLFHAFSVLFFHSVECGGRLTERIGVISSHNYPNNYPDNSNCTWNVWVTNSRTIHIKFIGTFNIPGSTDCGSDYVEVSLVILS